jgi:NLR family CARD domain-containing protein 3
MCQALQGNGGVTSVDLSANKITEASDLAELLRLNTTLTSLLLQGNTKLFATIDATAGGKGQAKVFAKGLEENSTLVTLDLSVTGIMAESPPTIVYALEANTSITSLNLSRNPLAAGGASAEAVAALESLAEVLQRNSTLTSIDLTHTLLEKHQHVLSGFASRLVVPFEFLDAAPTDDSDTDGDVDPFGAFDDD